MRTRISALLLAPVLLLAMACTDQLITTPHEALLGTGGEGMISEATSFQAILLSSGPEQSLATAINDGGVVAGYQGGMIDAVRWTVSASQDVSGPHLLGPTPAPFDEYMFQLPSAINSEGQIVGVAHRSGTGNRRVAFLYDSEMHVLPWLVGETWNWSAEHINDDGVVSGSIEYVVRDEDNEITGRETRGAIWFPPYEAEPTLLPPLEGHHRTAATHVSLSGVATGRSTETDESGNSISWVVVRWDVQSGGVVGDPVEVEGGSFLTATNDAGDIVGTQSGAKLLRSGIVYELGHLPNHNGASATAITDLVGNGTVGIAGRSGGGDPVRAVVWSVSPFGEVTGPIDLGLPGNRFESARADAVNNLGWVAGTSWVKQGSGRATVWLPVVDDGEPPPPGAGPTASFDYSCGNSPTCEFTDTSTEGEAAIVSRDWVTGSQTASGSPVSFTFGTAGDHVVTLTVTDADQASDQTSKTVKCRDHPRHGLRCS